MNEALGFFFANKLDRAGVALREDWRPPLHIMRVRRDDVGKAFAEHALAPIFGPLPEGARQGAGGNLHPDATLREIGHQLIMRLDPGQAFRMGDDRNITSRHDPEQEIAQTGRRRMMRRLDKNVSRICDREKMAASQGRNKVRNDVIIGACHEFERNIAFVEFVLQT